jgi:hypothetical protein
VDEPSARSAAGAVEILRDDIFKRVTPCQRLSPALMEKLKKLEDMRQRLQAALDGWCSQLLQQREALLSCFGLGDVELLIGNQIGDPAAAAVVSPLANFATQTASIDTFIRLMVSPPSLSSSPASALAAPATLASCVKTSRENLIYAAVGCRSVLAREAAAAASALTASAGMRSAVESEIVQLKLQIQEQQQQMTQQATQHSAAIKLHQVIDMIF